MAVDDQAEVEKEERCPDVAYLTVTPTLNNPGFAPKIFDAIAKTHPKALVLEVYASGTSPTVLDPLIKKYVDNGISVFLLSNNPGDEKGIEKLAYAANLGSVQAGAIPLRDVNVNQRLDVISTIQHAINEGHTGTDLNDEIISKYGTAAPTSRPTAT